MPRLPILLPLLGILLALAFGPAPAQAVDEAQQVQVLKKVFASQLTDWKKVLEENRSVLDASFFDRVERRIRWSLDNAQVEDAIRFAFVGDLAGLVTGRQTAFRIELAQVFLKNNNMQMALDLLENIRVTDPEASPSWLAAMFLYGSIMHDGGDLLDAYVVYQDLHRRGYRKAEVAYRMALIELRRNGPGDEDLARTHLEEAVRLDPNFTLAREELSRLLNRVEYIVPPGYGDKPGTATPSPTEVSADAKNRSEGFLKDAEIAREQGDLTRAIELYQDAVEANPKNVSAQKYLGAALFTTRNLDAAIGHLEVATGLDPKDVEAWTYLGYCYERRFDQSGNATDLDKARLSFEKGVQLQPDNQRLKMDYDRVQDKLQDKRGQAAQK